VIIAQITDTHIRRKGKLLHHMVNPGKRLRKAIERIRSLDPKPDVVLATGDLTEAGKYVIPGNHDRREAFREAFADQYYLPAYGPLQYTIEEYPVRLIALDTMNDGEAGGVMDEERLAWLDAKLKLAPNRPTLIFMHHPPFRTGIRALDALGFRGSDELGAIVRRNPQIERIICGHVHRAIEMRWYGTTICTALSTAHQFALELRSMHPLGIVLEPPGFALHIWGEGEMATHHCLVSP
jgi:3',5'-cyclic AMP phosphodiesterase CpdA